MSLSLKDALFETNEKNLHKLFEKAEIRKLEDNIQALNDQKLKAVVKAIANALNSKLPDPENVKLEKVMASPLGVFELAQLKALSNVPIAMGLKIDPVNIKGEQSQGIDPLSYNAADDMGMMPIQIVNKFGQPCTPITFIWCRTILKIIQLHLKNFLIVYVFINFRIMTIEHIIMMIDVNNL